MTQSDRERDDRIAESVVVVSADGVRVPGWVVLPDVVVFQAEGLAPPFSVTIDGERIEGVRVHTRDRIAGAEVPTEVDGDRAVEWVAIELPDGSRDAPHDVMPPALVPDDDPRTLQARVGFWCLLFPRMRGCG